MNLSSSNRSVVLILLLGLVYVVAVSSIYVANATRGQFSYVDRELPDDIRFGIGVQDLPKVRVDYGKFKPPVNPGGADGNGDDDGETIIARRRACLTTGYYLGKDDAWTDCETLCNAPETEYRYYDGSGVFSGRRSIRAGAYCVPTLAAQCNVRTSYLVYSYEGWSCLPQTPGLVGNGGNAIALCDGRIRDNALARTYDKVLPPDVAFNNFYEDKLSDGETPRFSCVPNTKDDSHNDYVQSGLNRFQFLLDRCVMNIPYAAIHVAFENGECKCERDSGGKWDTDPENGVCTACRAGVEDDNLITRIASRVCWNSGDTFSKVAQILSKNAAAPFCGVGFNDSDDAARPRCVSAGIYYLNRPLVSPAALITSERNAVVSAMTTTDYTVSESRKAQIHEI